MFPTTPTQGVAQPPTPAVGYPQPQTPFPTIPQAPAPTTFQPSAFLTPAPRQAPRWLIIVVFCLFAGLIPETIVTSSTSPLKILLSPISLPFIALFYGTADLVIREILVRRRTGLASVLLLGAAFGFVNEGVAAGTWYTVRPQGYLFIGGVDWTWAFSLTIFHTIISVIVPIAFIEIVFPSIRGKPLLRRLGIIVCTVLFLGFALLIALTPLYRPYRLAALAVAVLFTLLALALTRRRAPAASVPTPALTTQPLAAPMYPGIAPASYATPTYAAAAPPPTTQPPAQVNARLPPGLWRLRIVGFLAMFGYFFVIYVFPAIVAALLKSAPNGLLIAQGVDAVALLAFSVVVISRSWSWSRRAGWSPRQNLALLIGGVAFTTLVMFLPGQLALGEPLVAIPFDALLIALAVRWRRLAASPTPSHRMWEGPL